MEDLKKVASTMYEAFCNFLVERAIAEGDLIPEDDEDDGFEPDEQFDEDGRPRYLLCDEIWEILDDAGHGSLVTIHHDDGPTEVLVYNRYASQLDNVHFMDHIFEEMEKGCVVTVNHKNIFDLY